MVDALTWLTLLVEDAPAERLEAHRIASLGHAADDEARERIDAEARRALHLRALLTERRQRSAELSALLDLARRLSSFRDVDALLQEIVTQARRLLSVDVAYLALVESDENLRIQVTDGSTGGGMLGAQLSPHTGIAGRVATTGEPFRTPDYLNETAITHVASVDNIASREGLFAIAGVPLRVGDRVVGVLFASDRSRRDFTDADVSLLSSLASHAAVALENARLFEELVQLNVQLREQRDTTQRAVALHERLTGVVLRGGSTDDVLHALEEVVPGSMHLVGIDDDVADSGRHRTVVPVTAGDDPLGSLVALTAEPPDPPALRLLERSALTLALVLLADRSVVEAQARTRNEVLGALLSGAPSSDVDGRLRAIGVDIRQPHCVAVIDIGAEHPRDTRDRMRDVTLVGEFDGAVVALRPGDDAGEFANELTKLFDRSTATVAVDGPAVGAAAIAGAYGDGRRGVQLLLALGRAGSVATVDELGPYRYLFGRAGAEDASRFVERMVGALLDHDRTKNSDLVGTLDSYLANAQQHAASAAALGIHANTLYQRLGRITELLGDEWRTRALELHLAIRLHRLSGKVGDLSL